MRNPDVKVSVVMPAYNAEAYIEKAIESVLDQTERSIELLVVDDCSQDGTAAVVEAMAARDDRIHLIRNEKNIGTAGCRNKALDLCSGAYVAFLDSDDVWHPEKVERQIKHLQETGADLCYTSYQVVHQAGSRIRKDYYVIPEVTLKALLKQNWIGCSTVMLTAETAGKYRFPTGFYHEDYVFWLRMLQDGIKAVGVTDVLMYYSFSSSSRAGNKARAAKRRWIVYRKYMNFSLVKTAWYMAHYAIAGVKKYKS